MNFTTSPTAARFTDENIMIKDYHYYKGKDNLWNRPAHVNTRFYKYYHQKQDAYQPAIEQMKDQEYYEKEAYEYSRKEWLLNKQLEDRIRMHQRKQERSLVDTRLKPLSDFDFSEMDPKLLDYISKKTNTVKHHRIKDNQWNFLHLTSQKNLETVVTPTVIRGEENAIQIVQNKIQREIDIELKLRERKELSHDRIRMKFLKRQEQNQNFEKTIGVSPQIERMRMHYSKSHAFLPTKLPVLTESTEMAANLEISHRNFMKEKGRAESPKNRQTFLTEKLSKPKDPPSPHFSYQDPDLHGLLVRTMDDNTLASGDKFYQNLKNKSPLFQEAAEKARASRIDFDHVSQISQQPSQQYYAGKARAATNQTPIFATANLKKLKRPSLDSLADNLEIEQNDNLEIKEFHRNASISKHSVGYAKVNLEEAIAQSSASLSEKPLTATISSKPLTASKTRRAATGNADLKLPAI